MTTGSITVMTRSLSVIAAEIAISGDVTSASEAPLLDAYARVSAGGASLIILDFSGLDYMNSGGIGLLVTLLVKVQRAGQRLMAAGLSEHYRQILALTRLDEAIAIHATVADALKAGAV